MNWCKIVFIVLVIIIGILFLIYFLVTIKKLNPVINVKVVDINGSKFLQWDSNNTVAGIEYVIGLNVGGFLDKRRTNKTQIPLFRCDIPVKSIDTGIPVQFVIIARKLGFANSPAVNGTLTT